MKTPGIRRAHRADPGFTLIELVLVLTIISLMIGASIPSFVGLENERAARVPVTELLSLAKDARMRAKTENRPYQIILDAGGAFAMRYASPYEEHSEFKERFDTASLKSEEEMALYLKENTGADDSELFPNALGASGSASVIEEEPWVSEPSWIRSYQFPKGISCSVRSWGENQFKVLQGEEMRRWVFQPSGLCDPLTVRIEQDGTFFQVSFDPLTADIAKEESYVE